jgi:predicted GIY-YIG superfamily endonuclease
MEIEYFIYKITRPDGKSYIGVSKDPESRLKQHVSGNGNQFLFRQTGLVLEILKSNLKKDEAFELEKEYILKLSPELNIAEGGRGGNTGNAAKGEASGNSKLTEEQVLDIRVRHWQGESQLSLARCFNVTGPTVNSICTGKTWTHVGGPTGYLRKNKTEKITLVKELKELGLTPKEINQETGISITSIYRYLNL